MRSREIPQLHRKHLRWQDLATSPCLWTGGCQEEVWWICQCTHRQDMPTHLLCTDRRLQQYHHLVQSPMQAHLSHPWCQHWAVKGAPQGELWQKSIWSTGDQLHILCHWIWSSCNVCQQGHPCPLPRPSTSEEQATEVYPTVPQLHLLTFPWPWQLSFMECHLQWLFQKRPLSCKVQWLWCCR